jgi:hypothetical protein
LKESHSDRQDLRRSLRVLRYPSELLRRVCS